MTFIGRGPAVIDALWAFFVAGRGYAFRMKRLPCLLVFLCGFALVSSQARAAEPAGSREKGSTPGIELATLATQVTGIAISPVLGVSGVGAYQYFRANTPEKKAKLPWFAHPLAWCCGLLIAGACAFKDAFGTMIPPGMKKPFDVLELAENKLSGLVATGAVIPVLVNAASKYLGGGATADAGTGSLSGLAMIHFAAIDFSWLLNILMVPLAIAVFAVVWITSHAINVLILLSPWGGVDAALKGARTAVLGLVTATAYIDPVVGVSLSLAIVIVAYFCAGWALRLTVFGTVFTWDFLTFRRHRFQLAANENWVFTGRRIADVPVRTYGRLRQAAQGGLELVYRPWLVLTEKTAALPASEPAVGRGLLWPTVETRDADGKDRTLLTLPPRYKGHEEAFAQVYGIAQIREVGLRRGWAVLRDLFRGSAPRPAPVSAAANANA